MEKVKQAFNRGILEEVVDVDLLKTLEMLSRVIGNVVKFPTEAKYRKIPADNKMFNEAVVDSKGGVEFVVACGFFKKELEGKTFWVIENLNSEVLQGALNLVNERIDKIKKKQDQEYKRLDEEREKEKRRVELANKEFIEDRLSFEERLQYTGGTKDSVATKVRTQDEIRGVQPNPLGGAGGGQEEPEEEGEDEQ